MELALREHQTKVIDALREGFRQGHQTQLLYAPTGFGKTEVAIALMQATKEKWKRAAMVLDRLVLVDQTSLRLTKYNLQHGVYQAGHWNWAPAQLLQVCSAQTLERRDNFPKVDLLIVDECHIARKQTTEFIKANPDIKVIGLTATPFTKGLGDVYKHIVCGATNEWLVDNKWLTPLRVYIAKEIDMTGAKKVAGEWAQDVVTERGMKITGDIVEEWIKKTHEIFGKPEKTIVFCAGVAHGADLVEQFARKGYNFVSISYKDNDDFKREAIEDFAKPDTQIHGLIATDILTRGFDVPDVRIGISARPFSKSLSSHVQQMGRIMRPHHNKEFAVWLCLAKGSLVLTDVGLVPIDKVKLTHKIWDGTNFVAHGGAVCNGIQKVITYQGLTATPGHLVHTAKGWRTFGECAAEQIRITQTGFGGVAVRLGKDLRPTSFLVGRTASKIYSCFVRMRDLWVQKPDKPEQLAVRKNKGLPFMQPAGCDIPNVALQQSAGDEGKVRQQKPHPLSRIRRARSAIHVFWGQGSHALDHEQLGFAGVQNGDRAFAHPIGQDRSRWSLRAWESALAFCGAKPTEQTRQPVCSANAQVQDGTPRNSICRQHLKAFLLGWHDGRANHRKIQPTIHQTKREVWDILDAGPNNRFTCEGLLVHNCHSGNYLRFRDDWDELYCDGVSSLDRKIERAKKEPTELEKAQSKCPSCGFLWPKAAEACPACGHVRQRRNKVEAVAGRLEELQQGYKAPKDDRQGFYSELIYFASQRGYNPHWAAHKYREKFGMWPRGLSEAPRPTSLATQNWIKSRNIAWAKTQNKLWSKR